MRILECSPYSEDATEMLHELSQSLLVITGNDGKQSFDLEDMCHPNSKFVLAYCKEQAVGCGAFRPITPEIAELKRMYAKYPGQQIGLTILKYLEAAAKVSGYRKIWLETRAVNTRAISFYERNDYHRIANYGNYVSREDAVCFEKNLIV